MKRAALLALLLVACKRKGEPPRDPNTLLRIALCACKDVACLEKVAQEFQRVYGVSALNAPADEKVWMQQCITKISRASVDAGAPSNLPAMPPRREADALINAARVWQQDERLAVAEVTISYVDASGVLDDTHGTLTIAFGAATRPVDDPKRKTGAPVTEDTTRPESCPAIVSMPDRGWSAYQDTCRDAAPYLAKCAVTDIWQRAIKLGAPKDALAVITFKNVEPPMWTFNITDEPRDVHIAHELPDDCERTLEKP